LSNFNDTLDAIHTQLVAAHNNETYLSDINTFKKGVFYNSSAFPVLAILPKKEIIRSYFSSNKYVNERSFSIEIYTKNAKKNLAVAQCSTLLEELKTYIKSDIDWGDISFDTEIPSENYYEERIGSQFVIGQNIIIRTLFDETLPTYEGGESPTVSSTDAVDGLLEIFEYYARTVSSDNARSLKEIKGLYKDDTTENLKVPGIMVKEENSQRERKYRGADVLRKNYSVDVYTKLFDRSGATHQLLRIVDKVKDIILMNVFKERLFRFEFEYLES